MFSNFFNFWKLYPKKMAFKRSMEAWNLLNVEQHKKAVETISAHAELWKMEGRESRYIPMCFSWLDGERWADEIQLPEPELKTPSNVIDFAKQKNIEARPGESMEEFTQRVRMTR
jgi:hypothetical protein